MEDAHDKVAYVEIAATKKSRNLRPTTIAGVMAMTVSFAEHMDRYPGCGWIAGEATYDDPSWFADGMIRSLAAAMATIGATA